VKGQWCPFLKHFLSVWNVFGQEEKSFSPLLQKRTVNQEDFFNSSINLLEMHRAHPVRSASMNAEFQKGGGVIVG